MVSLSYYKGFSTINSLNDIETIEIIYRFINKILRETNKKAFYNIDTNLYNNNNNNNNLLTEPNKYVKVIKSTKKANITKDNINIIMLMQIPGVSVQSATSIINEYKTITNLTNNLEKNLKCLDDIRLESNNRKLGKNIIENIKKYLLDSEEVIMNINI